jgi:hypothetical protein
MHMQYFFYKNMFASTLALSALSSLKTCTSILMNFGFQILSLCMMWGTSHGATGAIESGLKYVSPDAHWIARRLATAGGKRIKTRPLSTAATTTHTRKSSLRQSEDYSWFVDHRFRLRVDWRVLLKSWSTVRERELSDGSDYSVSCVFTSLIIKNWPPELENILDWD